MDIKEIEIKESYKDIRVITLRQLKEINNESVACGYNRNIWFNEFSKKLKESMYRLKGEMGTWRGMKTRVMLEPLMVHEHKKGVMCEPHMRCRVNEFNLVGMFLTLDVPMNTFNKLTTLAEEIIMRKTYAEAEMEVA